MITVIVFIFIRTVFNQHILAGQQTLRLRGGSEGEFDRLPRWGGGHVLDTRQRADGSVIGAIVPGT